MIKAIAPYVSAGGQVAGAIGAGRTAGRAQENAQTMNRDEAELDRYRIEQLAKMSAANLTEEATQDRADRQLTNAKDRAQQVGLGDLMANVQDVEIGGLPSYINQVKFSGGLRPSALGPMSRQAGTNLAQQALQAQMTGSDIPDLPDVSQLGTDAPEQSALQESGKLDSILSALGMAGMPFQAYEEMQRRKAEETRLRLASQGGQQRQAELLTPAQVPTSLLKPTPQPSAVEGLFNQRRG